MASKKYIRDYDLVETEDEQGRVKKTAVYRGDYFTINLDESQIKQFKRDSILLTLAILLIQVAGGFVANPGMYKIFIALPYTAAFLPLLYLTMAVFRLPDEKRPFRKEEVGLSYERIKTSNLLYLIFTIVGWLGTLIYLLFLRGDQAAMLDLIYLALITFSAVLAWLIHRKAKIIEITTVEKAANEE